jgi:hypothetical protein
LAFSSASDVGASSTSHIRKMGIICNFDLELAEKPTSRELRSD